MPTPPIAESPSARVLLELAAASADARLNVGGRAVLLRGGAIADIATLPGDLSFGEFLLAAGRIEARDLEAVIQCADEHCIGLDQALRELDVVSDEVLFMTRRALLLDRLARAFASEEDDEREPSEPTPLTQLMLDSAYPTPELVFDALARRAAAGLAEVVGSLPTARFVWQETAEQRRAADWADLGEIPIAVSLATLFRRHPSAPSRIAALLRAGVAQLDVTESNENEVATQVEQAPSEDGIPAPAGADAGQEEPSEAALPMASPVGPLGLGPVPPWLGPAQCELACPLTPIEQRAAELEAGSAAPRERVDVWLELAQGWITHQHSFIEAARAAREAAAAGPADAQALAHAAAYSAAAGQPEIAVAYARSWAEHEPAGEAQARAYEALASFAERAGVKAQALAARQRAVELLPSDAELQIALARTLAAGEEVQLAIEHARKAAELVRVATPDQARALLEWSTQLAPANLRTWNDLARVLGRAGRTAAAVATLARAARVQSDSAVRERLRTAALNFAEAARRPDDAAELLLETVAYGQRDHEQLLANLYAAAEWPTLLVLATELAEGTTGAAKTTLLIHAAEAAFALEQPERAIALLIDAVVGDPEHAEAFDRLHALAHTVGRAGALCDALEKAVRVRCPAPADAHALSAEVRSEVIALAERLQNLLTDFTSAPLARFVSELLYELDGRTLGLEEGRAQEQAIAQFESELQQRERALRAAPAHARSEPALHVAALCRLDPARRKTARKLYAKLLERDPRQPQISAELESLLRLEGDDAGLRALFEGQAAAEPDPRPLVALAYLDRSAGEIQRALDVCFRAVSPSSRDPEALTLALQLARTAGDANRERTALRMLTNAALSPAQRARIWMRLARAEFASGERSEAARAAHSALRSDIECAEAALWIVAECEQLPTSERAGALTAARHALGDSPELLRKLARASYAHADANVQIDALVTLRAVCPWDGFAARALVALYATGRDASALAQALDDALLPACFAPETPYVAQRGLERLVALGNARDACEIVVDALPALGERIAPLLPWAEAAADGAGAPDLACALLEQRVALADGEAQVERLRELGQRYRKLGVRWAAARAALRLLALRPEDTRALEELAAIYAETGESERLQSVLEALHEGAHDEAQRAERTLDLALFALHYQEDLELAVTRITAVVSPTRDGRDLHEVGVEALRRGVGLLRAHTPQRARDLMLELARTASPTRSRELFEEALLLAEHELRDPVRAFEVALEATLAHPDHEPFTAALARLARPASRIEAWVDALEAAADRTANIQRQAQLLVSAGKLCEEELHDGARACVMLDRAYRATPTYEIEELALAAARRLYGHDLRAGKLAYDRLRDTLHVRAKFAVQVERAQALITLSRLADEVYLSREDANRYVDAARGALASAEDAEPAERDRVLAALNERITQMAQLSEPKPISRAPAARRGFSEVEALSLDALHTAGPTHRPGGVSLSPTVRPGTRSLIPTLEPQAPLVSLAPIDIRAHGITPTAIPSGERERETSSVHELEASVVATADSLDASLAAVASGQSAALDSLTRRVQVDPATAPAICAALLAQVRGRKLSVVALRGLRIVSAAASEHALWRTSSQALAFVEPHLRPPTGARRRDAQGAHAIAALQAARESEQHEAFELLAMLVESAAPLFRRNIASVIRTKEAPEPLREAPYAQLLSELGQILGQRLDAYLAPSGEDRVSLSSAQPANIIIGDRTARDAAGLRFRLGRAFECARPEHILLTALAREDGDALFAALPAAFGPAGTQDGPKISRAGAALSADLWRTMPSNAQRKLTRMLGELPHPLSFADLLFEVRLRSARVALFATREVDVALAQLGRDLDASAGSSPLEPRSEGDFNRALGDDTLVRELVAYALSDAYLRSLQD